MAMLDKFASLADKLEADAAGIRRRAAGASTKSMSPMRCEAAALERAAAAIRAQVAAATDDDDSDLARDLHTLRDREKLGYSSRSKLDLIDDMLRKVEPPILNSEDRVAAERV